MGFVKTDDAPLRRPAGRFGAGVRPAVRRCVINKGQRAQMAHFRSVVEPYCDEPILGLCYLFARGSIIDWALHGFAGGLPTPVPGVPDVIVDKVKDAVTDAVRDQHRDKAGGRSQALCAVTEPRIVVVGVAPAPSGSGLAANFNRLTVITAPLVFERTHVGVTVSKRLLSRLVTFTDQRTQHRYEFEVHTAGTGDFNVQFFDALNAYVLP
jgi:hypothetical protein